MRVYKSFLKKRSSCQIVLVNYSDRRFRNAQILNSISAILFGGVNKVLSFGFEDLEKDFVDKNKFHFKSKKGAGYWLWKPYVILKALENIESGEFLFYCDSGSIFKRNISHLVSKINLEQDIITFELPYLEKAYTKQFVFEELGCDSQDYKNTFQRLAGFIFIRKTPKSIEILKQWLFYSEKIELIDDSKLCENQEYFVEHRHDQSIFSLIVKKNNLSGFRDPSQFGNSRFHLYPESNFPNLIYLHRKGKIGLRQFFKILSEILFKR